MKYSFSRYFVIVIISITILSCSQDNQSVQFHKNENLTEQQHVNNLCNEIDSLPQNVLKKRKASIILADFVKLENNQYRLDISKNEAEQLGVSPELYDEIVADLYNTNIWILEAIENGDSIEIPDIQAIAKEYKKQIMQPLY